MTTNGDHDRYKAGGPNSADVFWYVARQRSARLFLFRDKEMVIQISKVVECLELLRTMMSETIPDGTTPGSRIVAAIELKNAGIAMGKMIVDPETETTVAELV